MRTTLDAPALQRELALRGMTGTDLARAAGLSRVTVSHALNGGQIETATLRKLARALTAAPPMAGASEIVGTASASLRS